jgi:transcriptional regulator with XRE-family HTH domain
MKVSAFISYHLKHSRKTHVEIAREVGLSSSNTLSMIKNGTMKIPLDRVPALADSLGISAQSLFVRCLQEYDPGLWEAIQLCLPGAFLSDEDLEMMLRIKGKLALLKRPRRWPVL